MTTEILKKAKTADELVAERLNVDPVILKNTLKATVFKVKDGDRTRAASDEEFMSLMIVANTYNLNPITKELYAYPDKGGGIVPIVSTDGWNRLMTTHPDYVTHSYRYSEKNVTPPGGKPCPEWCEIDIEKKDGSHVVIREYLDEVFRELSYANPWKTHTKRMLRHKTKIQGAREAFGFAGIYDEDEAARIIEIQPHKDPEMPRAKSATPKLENTENKPPEAPASESAAPKVQEPAPAAPEAAQQQETRPVPAGFQLLKAIQPGKCRSCEQAYKKGDDIAFNSTRGTFHPDCVA